MKITIHKERNKMDIELLKKLLVIAIAVSVIAVAFIQKTKGIFKSSKFIGLYSAVINMVLAVFFCLSFTDTNIVNSIWVGLFSYIGADTLYKSLEGKLESFSDILQKKEETEEVFEIKRDDI